MSFSPGRSAVFAMIALPIGFILSALAFTALAKPVSAPATAPFALGIALVAGIAAGFGKPGR